MSEPAHRAGFGLAALLSALKPRDQEILALAERETDPALARRFEPICHGPWIAVLALAFVGVASVPGIIRRVFIFLVGSNDRAA